MIYFAKSTNTYTAMSYYIKIKKKKKKKTLYYSARDDQNLTHKDSFLWFFYGEAVTKFH